MRTLAATVFSCGAARNKRNGELLPEPIGDLEPGLGHGFPIQILRVTRPAPGYRRHADGIPAGVGSYGYNWSSATSELNGILLDFGMHFLYTDHTYSRGRSIQLRCLSE